MTKVVTVAVRAALAKFQHSVADILKEHDEILGRLLQRIERLERKTDAIDEAQSMKLCQVREDLDRLI